MSVAQQMELMLSRMDGRPYPNYRQLKGRWDFDGYAVLIDHVQGDPFAAPSRVRLQVQLPLPKTVHQCMTARVAAEDLFLRHFCALLPAGRRGSGRSGQFSTLRPGPEIEERSAVCILANGLVEFRFRMGLPARGRRILSRAAWAMFSDDLSAVVDGLRAITGMESHLASVRRQRALRRQLDDFGLVAFVENGAVLPRRSGVDQEPLEGAVPFASPRSLMVTLEVDGESVTGMGIPAGVTLIVGGGFHGKSTLLNALQRGHLDHVPGDGREGVVSVYDSVKVRAEDGRNVAAVDISAFLCGLPGKRSTERFSTPDASGSTSQAAAVVEAVEAGATLLLLDEDTSATNLLVRDERMRALIRRSDEPITPFVERVQQLYEVHGVSTILVIGGVADYLGVADKVIGMVNYAAVDLTEKAHSLGVTKAKAPNSMSIGLRRIPVPPATKPGKISARDNRALRFDENEIQLVAVEQILSGDHAWSIGQAIRRLYEFSTGTETIQELLRMLDHEMDALGPDALSPRPEPVGDLIRPRRHEVAAALNRLRSLSVDIPDKT